MKRDNGGFTIVEIVVVVAILAVLTGTAIIGISQLGGFRAREGADTIANSLTQARIAMLGKSKGAGDMAWEILCDDGKYYVRTVYDVGTSEYYRDEKRIVDANVDVYVGETTKGSFEDTGTTTYIEMGEGASVRLYFNRSTGALSLASGATSSNNAFFRVKQGNKDYDIIVIAKTGKVITQTVR